jgi:hypothetical protein
MHSTAAGPCQEEKRVTPGHISQGDISQGDISNAPRQPKGIGCPLNCDHALSRFWQQSCGCKRERLSELRANIESRAHRDAAGLALGDHQGSHAVPTAISGDRIRSTGVLSVSGPASLQICDTGAVSATRDGISVMNRRRSRLIVPAWERCKAGVSFAALAGLERAAREPGLLSSVPRAIAAHCNRQ